MKIGVVGLGSMGKRRVRDLAALGHSVVGFDRRSDRNSEAHDLFGIPVTGSFEALLDSGTDAIVISTPPDQHLVYYELCFKHRRPFFSEANIFTPPPAWFSEREHAAGVKSYCSATWLFYPLFRILRDRLREIGLEQVNSIHYYYGGYLPYWHPWENYADYYAGARRTSAAREMVPFEMEWLCYVFGRVASVCAVRDRRYPWSTDIDDTYLVLLEFERGVRGLFTVELHQVAPFRVGRVSCQKHSFTLDIARHELLDYSLDSDSFRRLKPPGIRTFGAFDFEEIYRAEIASFVQALEGHAEYPKTWEEDRHLSTILYAAEESWRRRSWVRIDEAEALYDGISWVREDS
jgi:predicted dehydrogenase